MLGLLKPKREEYDSGTMTEREINLFVNKLNGKMNTTDSVCPIVIIFDRVNTDNNRVLLEKLKEIDGLIIYQRSGLVAGKRLNKLLINKPNCIDNVIYIT